jgi:hypothetical protein
MTIMSGDAWADCLGLLHNQAPLAPALQSLGLTFDANPPEQVVLEEAGLELEFRDGRLESVVFDPMVFEGDLPAGVPREGPLPAGFVTDATSDEGDQSHTLVLGAIEVHVLEIFGELRISVYVLAHGNLSELPAKPLSTALAAQPPAGEDDKEDEQDDEDDEDDEEEDVEGIPIGYGMGWLAVCTDDVSGVVSALGLHAPEPMAAVDAVAARAAFISAPRNGWRLVLGTDFDDAEMGIMQAEKLSRVLKTKACFFKTFGVVDLYAYARFDAGSCVRVWSSVEGEVQDDRGARTTDEPRHVDDDAVRDLAQVWSTAAVVPLEDGFRVRLRP